MNAAPLTTAELDPAIETITLGGRTFELRRLPWGRLKKLVVVLHGVAKGLLDESVEDATVDGMSKALSLGLGLSIEEFEALPTDQHEVASALRALLRVTGLQSEFEWQQDETIRSMVGDRRGPTKPILHS